MCVCARVFVCKCLFQVFGPFSLMLSVFWFLFFVSVVVLHVFWMQVLYHITNIFHSVACLFTLLTFLDEQKPLILILLDLSLFLYLFSVHICSV